MSGMAGRCPPPVPTRPTVLVAAGDHGVHAQGVTRWPQQITAAMVAIVSQGRAAVSVLGEMVGAEVRVLDVGVAGDTPAPPGIRRHRVVANGTQDLLTRPAMTADEATRAVLAGAALAAESVRAGTDLLVTGDLGIANTTPSACLIAALTGASPVEVVGRGAANDAGTVARKIAVVETALARHGGTRQPLGVLASLGGSEHAALIGVMLAGASHRVPVVLDGVIADAAALVAAALCPAVTDYLIAGHRSTEPGAAVALGQLGLSPLLDLSLALGEGSGAVLAVPLVRSAAALLSQMATLDQVEPDTTKAS